MRGGGLGSPDRGCTKGGEQEKEGRRGGGKIAGRGRGTEQGAEWHDTVQLEHEEKQRRPDEEGACWLGGSGGRRHVDWGQRPTPRAARRRPGGAVLDGGGRRPLWSGEGGGTGMASPELTSMPELDGGGGWMQQQQGAVGGDGSAPGS